jgi:sugar lactone lactonase YvrE
MSRPKLVGTVAARNTLGECILWDGVARSVWWTDIQEATLYNNVPGTPELRRYALPERLCSFGFVEGDPRLVCAFESGFALYEPASRDLQWLYRPERGFTGTRFNDGRVDRQGRFWSGTMVEGDARDGAGEPVKGSLYWVSAAGHGRVFGGIDISNSLAFSPNADILYFADSPRREIRAHDFDAGTGAVGSGRRFVELEAGVPDGSTVDAEGCLWNASWGASRVVRYRASGAVDVVIDVPVSQPTCVCFGGERLDLLFVSTAREGLTDAELEAQPLAGDVLVYETDYRGLPESRYRLNVD